MGLTMTVRRMPMSHTNSHTRLNQHRTRSPTSSINSTISIHRVLLLEVVVVVAGHTCGEGPGGRTGDTDRTDSLLLLLLLLSCQSADGRLYVHFSLSSVRQCGVTVLESVTREYRKNKWQDLIHAPDQH
mmetsp:Transcript_22011/g.54018  ORF Transcript_22011/g.54018 Transcript_22011/m.54018 type:complete len:129 (+) Transcript_22011:1749-2135(+)